MPARKRSDTLELMVWQMTADLQRHSNGRLSLSLFLAGTTTSQVQHQGRDSQVFEILGAPILLVTDRIATARPFPEATSASPAHERMSMSELLSNYLQGALGRQVAATGSRPSTRC